MFPTYALFDELRDLLATDPSSLAPLANNLNLHLSKSNFTPNQDRVVADFTEANFDGYSAIQSVLGAQDALTDPLTNERIVRMKIPAGGWHWAVSGLTHLPQTIYGFYLTDSTNAALWGCNLFPEPIPLQAVGQFVDIDDLIFRFLFNGIQ